MPFSISSHVSSVMFPARSSAQYFHTSEPEPRKLPFQSPRSEEHTSELQSPCNLVCRLLLEKNTAFGKLFVSTEFVPELGAILATRRRRSSGDPQIWAAHLAVVEGEASGDVQFETDRARVLR